MSHKKPPRLAQKLLLCFLRDDLVEEVVGDLREKFDLKVERTSEFKARISYWIEVIHYLRPFAIRKLRHSPLNQYAMYQNYFKISWRSLVRDKTYSSIKINGFAVGIAACLLIGLYVRQELDYDLHYINQDRIYRLLHHATFRGESNIGVHFPAPLTTALREEYPEFEKVGRYNAVEDLGSGSNEVRRLDQTESTHENGIIFVDQPLLEILEVSFISGDPSHALTEPNTIVITKSKADKYFSNEDPLGKVLIFNNDESRQYKVTAVVENFPVTSHLHCDFLIALEGKEFWKGEQTDWRSSNHVNYVRVRKGVDIAQLEQKLSGLLSKYMLPATIADGGNKEEIDWLKSFRFKLQPVNEIYLNKSQVGDRLPHGDLRYILLFSIIAVFILIIASINFINLSTAKSANRAREVGLRKVVGSSRNSLIKQFLSEAILYSLFSFMIGLLFAYLLLPYFNTLIGKFLIFPLAEPWLFPGMLVGALVIGILSGLYPSFYLSSFRPAQVLKGNLRRGSRSSSTRSLLVIFQFTVSIVLIVGTFIIHRQMKFILTKNLGFDKEQVLLLQGTHTLGDNVSTLKNELLRLPGVRSASVTGFIPVDGSKRNGGPVWIEGMVDEERISSQHWSVDHDYVNTMGLKLLEGRNFAPAIASDTQAMLINKTMADAFGFKDPVGQRIYNWQGGWTIIGVIEDFHFESFKQRIQPMALFLGRSTNTVSVKLETNDVQVALASITQVWKQFAPNQVIRYTFLDQRYAQMYEDVARVGKIFTSFALLAILVACLGLFALSSFMVEQRHKEISIRLVLGASISNIVQLLTQNFVKLVCISFCIATPLAWYMMQDWLQDYQYRINITFDTFLIAGCLSLGIALLTIGYQAISAALKNPAEGLRSEQ